MHECDKTARVGVERTSRRKRKKLDRLTRDAIAAQEAGMSYGQWKALHPHTPDEDDEKGQDLDPDSVVATCEHCGERFVKFKWQTTRRFCGAECQKNYNSKKRREKARQQAIGRTAVCPICGADFLVNYQHRIYCGPECYAEGQRQRNRDHARRKQSTLSKEELEIEPPTTVPCENCGEQFIKPKHQPRRRFCSIACKNAFYAPKREEKARREAAARTATCAICGETFTPANGNSKYCGECQKEAHNQKNREWYARKKEKQKKEAAKNGSV